MSSLSPKARALLARTAPKYEPTDADRTRLRHALASRMAMATAASAASTALASKAAATPAAGAAGAGAAATKASLGLGAKLLASMILLGSAGAGAVAISHSRSAAPPSASVADPHVAPVDHPASPSAEEPASVKPAIAAPVAATSSVAPAERTPRALPPVGAVVKRTESLPQDHADELMAEVALLRDAQTALRNHDGVRALEALDAHAREFPHGTLTPERRAARVFALCELGRVREAELAKASFLAAHPQSPEAERVRNACPSPR